MASCVRNPLTKCGISRLSNLPISSTKRVLSLLVYQKSNSEPGSLVLRQKQSSSSNDKFNFFSERDIRSYRTTTFVSNNAENFTAPKKDETELLDKLNENVNEENPDWKIKMLFDGDCPLCMREVDMLRERNTSYGTIKFVDISDPKYAAEENSGIDFETAMGRIHAIGSDGAIWTNIQAFQKLYEAVGLGWVYSFTKYPALANFADSVYEFWAKYRLPITGRPGLEIVLEKRRKEKEIAECDLDGRCKTD